MKVLLVTVGGSDKPIITSINEHNPGHIIFFCTQDDGPNKGSEGVVTSEELVCTDNDGKLARPGIIVQIGLDEKAYKIIIVNPDDPFDTYGKAEKEIKKYIETNDEIIVDYTGGTKSMAVGIATAAMESAECKLSVVAGLRNTVVKVEDGMERISKLPINKVFLQRQESLWNDFIKSRDYESAKKVLDTINAYGYIDDQHKFYKMDYLTKGFLEWDRFNYSRAARYIEQYKDEESISSYNENIKKIVATINMFFNKWTPESKTMPPGPGYLLVYDVLNNAERKGIKGYYDDAVSRIYRAIEMYPQFCLMTSSPRQISNNIDVALIQEESRGYYELKRNKANGKVQIGLNDNYKLLIDSKHPVGQVWKKWDSKITDALKLRNSSFLAHGMEPITKEAYENLKDLVWEFINECDEAMKFKKGLNAYQQLPSNLMSEEKGE